MGSIALKRTPRVPGQPLLGSLFGMVKGPADFFVRRYRAYGPVCRLSILGQKYVLISGVEAANFMGTRAGRDCLRSKEFWEGLLGEYGAERMLTGEDGDSHNELRDISCAMAIPSNRSRAALQPTRRDHRRLAQARLACRQGGARG